MALAGCAESPPDAIDLQALKELCLTDANAGLVSFRKAIVRKPADGALRAELSRCYLVDGRSDLAELSAKKAEDLGYPTAAARLLRAEALLAQRQFQKLRQLTLPSDSTLDEWLQMDYWHLEAEAATLLRPEDSLSLVRGYVEWLSKSQASETGSVPLARLGQRLKEASRERGELARAIVHQQCASLPRRSHRWQASAIPEGAIVVGPDRGALQQLAKTAPDGAVIVLKPGRYAVQGLVWRQNDLTLIGEAPRPLIDGEEQLGERRDIWLFTGDRVTVENIEMQGARSTAKNGAAIRHSGRDLTLRHLFLHDNENGVLTGNQSPRSRIEVVFSEFARNGDNEGYAHNLYIGQSGELDFRFNYTHAARGGSKDWIGCC